MSKIEKKETACYKALDTVLSSMKDNRVEEKIKKFTNSYMKYVGGLTVSDLCRKIGFSLEGIAAFESLAEEIQKDFIASFLNDPTLCDVKVNGHYFSEETHLFPFLLRAVLYCEKCGRHHCSYVCVYCGETGCGIAPFLLDGSALPIEDDIRTLKDVYGFLCDNTSLGDYPLLI